nr:hypothetical protein [Tanacetum cinerariifolium]
MEDEGNEVANADFSQRSLEYGEIEELRVFRDESNEWKEINASGTLNETV